MTFLLCKKNVDVPEKRADCKINFAVRPFVHSLSDTRLSRNRREMHQIAASPTRV